MTTQTLQQEYAHSTLAQEALIFSADGETASVNPAFLLKLLERNGDHRSLDQLHVREHRRIEDMIFDMVERDNKGLDASCNRLTSALQELIWN